MPLPQDLALRDQKVGKAVKSREADYVVEHIHNLAQVIPEIWVGGTGGGDQE
uniref:Uncharacterized protein n=1 Tax=Salix viminalis TaxID=40686 RepID=A0A6N2NE39_SALVM